jgi:hypothetical protein
MGSVRESGRQSRVGRDLAMPPERAPRWWPYQDEFPDWRVWQGQNKRYYARLPETKPLVIVNAADAQRLRDEIIRAKS